jgi:hypothetical protein
MSIYELRDERGYLKAKISENIAKTIVANVAGSFRDVKLEGGAARRVFELSEDMKFGDLERTGIEVMLWRGDRIGLNSPAPNKSSSLTF